MPSPARLCLSLALLVALVAPHVLAGGCTSPNGGFSFYTPRGEGNGPGLIRILKGSQVSSASKCRSKCNNHNRCYGYVYYKKSPSSGYYVQGDHIYTCRLYDSTVQSMGPDQTSGATFFYDKEIYGGRCW